MKNAQAILRKEWADTGIVLGCGTTKTGKLSPIGKKRADKAYELLSEGYISKLILSGGCGTISEAKAMQDYLVTKGIAQPHLIIEEKSKDTIGNAIYSKYLVGKSKRIVLITSASHMNRALTIFTHVFGNEYSIIGCKSEQNFIHHLRLWFREWETKKLDELFLSQTPLGNHKEAEKFLHKMHPKYKELNYP